ncbi:MAG: cation:proton antiporter [Cyclobacteriaceae bacterium]|nr:cation:proton antiporter [Cyclobacteriaceae bacterium]MCH8516421.1 cation:proton antiporter [Cyclobacteriaceae bacterium]
MTLFEISLIIAITIISLGILLAIIRLIMGPFLPDRVTAFDLISANVIAIIAIFAVLSGSYQYFDVAVLLSLIIFFGAVSFTYHMNKVIKKRNEKLDEQLEESEYKDKLFQ